jgi:dTMP kinase
VSAGFFVVVEGPEGAGKTTLAAELNARFRAAGEEPIVVREPGGTPAAEALRRELLELGGELDGGQELLFSTAARADLVARIIRPALSAGRVVLSDRFALSTVAYQGAGRGLPMEMVDFVNRCATGGLAPDLTLILDVDPAEGTGNVGRDLPLARAEEAGVGIVELLDHAHGGAAVELLDLEGIHREGPHGREDVLEELGPLHRRVAGGRGGRAVRQSPDRGAQHADPDPDEEIPARLHGARALAADTAAQAASATSAGGCAASRWTTPGPDSSR